MVRMKMGQVGDLRAVNPGMAPSAENFLEEALRSHLERCRKQKPNIGRLSHQILKKDMVVVDIE